MKRFLVALFILILSSLAQASTWVSIDEDFSKWHIITNDLKAPSKIPKNVVTDWGAYLIYVESKNGQVFISKGFAKSEFQSLLQKKRMSARIWNLFFQTAQANQNCLTNQAQTKIAKLSEKITAESILTSCEWNPLQLVQETVQEIITEAKGLLSLDVLKKIDEVVDSAKYLIAEFKNQILPGLSKLAEVSPDLVNTWACTKIRDEIPVLALSAAVPGMAFRRSAKVLVEALDEVRFLISEPMLKLVRQIARDGRLEVSALNIAARLTPQRPEIFDRLTVHPRNLERHAAKHATEYSQSGESIEYFQGLDRFINQKDSKDIYLQQKDGSISKFNPESGDVLVVSKSGNFITFYKAEGSTPEDRMLKFINKSAASERKIGR